MERLYRRILVAIVATFVIMLWMFFIGNIANAEEMQKFKVTYKVTYNSISLEDASKIEKRVRAEHKEACTVKVKVEESNGFTTTIRDGAYVIYSNEEVK